MFLGIDIGSSSSKVAIINNQKEIAATSVVNMGTGTVAYEEAIRNALEQAKIRTGGISYVVATGYGRFIFGGANKQITEISCHARGARFLMGDIKTIIDIGGQDAKVIIIGKDGQIINFAMNEKCAAGTGRFLEVMARVFTCNVSELSEMADRSLREVSISSMCTVFAESEVISRLSAGENVYDVARGVHVAMAKRIAGMVKRLEYGPKIVMTGGVALNKNMVKALSRELEEEIEVATHCQAIGAIGAAVYAYEIFNKGVK